MFINAIPNGRNNDLEDDYVDDNDDNDDNQASDDNGVNDDNDDNNDAKNWFSVCNIHDFILYFIFVVSLI